MKIDWIITSDDVSQVRAVMDRMQDSAFVLHRAKNLRPRGEVDLNELWFQMMAARLTTRQRSGPDSPVTRFISRKPFPLALPLVQAKPDAGKFITATIRRAGGMRFADKIGVEMAVNLGRLVGADGQATLAVCNGLVREPGIRTREQAAARALMTYVGFGPKQSRNVLQALGLTRHEVPIDSRLTRWLNDLGFPVRLRGEALSDPDYYDFVSDGFNKLCEAAGVPPCMLDAAIFSASDPVAWSPDVTTG